MMRTQYIYYRKISPFAIIGFILMGLAFFFLALPVFLAALAVFSGVAAYMAWRIKRAIREMEKECIRRDNASCAPFRDEDQAVIDITPGRHHI